MTHENRRVTPRVLTGALVRAVKFRHSPYARSGRPEGYWQVRMACSVG